MIVTPKTTTSVNVTMKVDEHSTDVIYYEAGYQREYCTVLASASQLSCTLENFSAGTRYRIFGVACMENAECSHRKFGDGYTLPEGTFTA